SQYLPRLPLSISLVFALLLLVSYLTGCSDRPTDAQLEALRQEAVALNAMMVGTQVATKDQTEWELVIDGQTATGKSVRLSWSELEALATTLVQTKDPNNTSTPDGVFNFRGIAVSKLLDRFGVAPDVQEVTFVAYDGYRSTVSLADLRQYPITIALERDRQKISRSEGGPLYLVFPNTEFPQLEPKYPDRFWVFYVTDMIIGTEPIQLKVGDHSFDAATLQKLPQVSLEENVGYRIGWPVGDVKLHGVLMQDVLAAAGVTVPSNGAVIVRGKPPIYRDPTNPIRLKGSDIENCNILLATHWGDDRKPIPANMGGPVTLALSDTCETHLDDRRWMTFVEELEIAN
ncbi:molybdopterin-dependent oxidoreductase, partial [Coleofasciculus sp. LEGE 07092]|uniref:molybdopterin-dependent oxidoreductase n=2 Tax=unclassified Coleofasciculus TaxID=2692782 RepID=UPI001D145B96